MARERSPERDKARQLFLDSAGKIPTKEIAELTGVKPEQVRKWKSLDKWQQDLEKLLSKRKRGAQPGNKNATGAGAPYGNLNAQTHGAYSAVHLFDLPPEQREYIESLTLDTQANMLHELQLLMAKETDLRMKIHALETGDKDALFVDRVVEMLVPDKNEKLQEQREKLDALITGRNNLLLDIEFSGKAATKQQQQQLDKYERQIAELQDKVSDAERSWEGRDSGFKINMQTVIKASTFDRAMKLEAELNKIHGRIIKLLDSIKSYELEHRRVGLEERKYNLAKQKLSGAFDIDPDTGEINDVVEISADFEG